MKIRSFILLLAILMAPLSVSAQIIKVAGSSTVKVFMDHAVEAYHKLHPDVQIDAQAGGSGVGVASVMDRSVHLGMISRELDAVEKAALTGVEQIAVGIDAVAVAISDELYHGQHLHSLSRQAVAAIYLGEIDNWSEVGGPDRHIMVIEKEMHRGTRQVFASHILGDSKAPTLPQAVVIGPNRHMQTLLKTSDQAIGYLTIGDLDKHVHGVEIIVDGKAYAPTMAEVRSGAYPLSRMLYLLMPENVPDYVRQFVEFLTSPEALPALNKAGYLSLQ
ncbi:phosphate transport system substrate-binding protein [Mariprofundus micogutta]|uniref:Phosphate transport system substrate-binding protein n=1 Tax=Mariprofundus micogutta TaxID=1921010 RepID=A0A1L8CKJ1_9PROT|nr:substrate-binding domain-containing protein [Mariprofundus micogutta]GAV19405.1 phosphate transport system substrate-binding protein [Mariprofundus micogutta]